jgi:hypothetical protein
MIYGIHCRQLKHLLEPDSEAYFDSTVGKPGPAKLADFMALLSHDQTGAPFVTWMLPDSLLQSFLLAEVLGAFGLSRASNQAEGYQW